MGQLYHSYVKLPEATINWSWIISVFLHKILENQENMEVRFPPCHAWSQRWNISDPFTIGIATMIYIYMKMWNDMEWYGSKFGTLIIEWWFFYKKKWFFQVFNGDHPQAIDHPRSTCDIFFLAWWRSRIQPCIYIYIHYIYIHTIYIYNIVYIYI